MIKLRAIAKKYGVSPPTIYEWIKKGCPSYTVGRMRFFDEKEVEDWIKTNKERQS